MNGPTSPARTMLIARVAMVATVAVGLVVAHQYGVFEQFGNPGRLKETLIALGGRGQLAFVVAYAALQPFVVPGTIFILTAPLIWPWHVAFMLSMAGTMAASLVGFGFARFVAREWVSRRIPERFRRYDDALETRAFLTVFLLRLILWMPPVLHAFFGASRVSFAAHFWGSLAGYALPLFLVSYFGQALFDAIVAAPLWVWLAAGAVTVAGAAVGWRWFRNRR